MQINLPHKLYTNSRVSESEYGQEAYKKIILLSLLIPCFLMAPLDRSTEMQRLVSTAITGLLSPNSAEPYKIICMQYLKVAVEEGKDPVAENALGVMMLAEADTYYPVEQDIDKGFALICKASKDGYEIAQTNMNRIVCCSGGVCTMIIVPN